MVMPRMGESVMECTVIGILKKVGDRVEADDSVMEAGGRQRPSTSLPENAARLRCQDPAIRLRLAIPAAWWKAR